MLPSSVDEGSLPPLLLFDVNKFLKKTFSDYDVGRHELRCVSNLQERSRSLRLDDNRIVPSPDPVTGGSPHSVPARRRGQPGHGLQGRIGTSAESEDNVSYGMEIGEGVIDGTRFDQQSRDGTYCCAYCGQEVVESASAPTGNNLYCASCTSFFTRYSPSELRRRIEYDEMIHPTVLSCLPNSTLASTSRTCNETAPLLTVPASDIVQISSHNTGVENGHTEHFLQTYEREPQDSGFGHRYARNEWRATRRGRASMNFKHASLSPYRRQRMAIGKFRGKSVQMNSLPVEAVTAGMLWGKETGGSSRRSSCTSASSWTRPTCRICHLHESGQTMVAPCRCAGTVQYVHTACLVHWLEISTKKVLPSPQCELCGYHYRTHHCYKFQRMYTPSCNRRDRLLHVVFAMMVFIMIGCAGLSAVYLRQDKGAGYKRSSLNSDDIIVIASALLFFCAFFVAVFTQYRAETSVCRLCLRCWLINRHWRVKDYDANLDYERRDKVGRSALIVEQI